MNRKKYTKRKKKKIRLSNLILAIIAIFLVLYCAYYLLWKPLQRLFLKPVEPVEPTVVFDVPVTTDYIEEGSNNRPGIIREIKYIVIHETGNFEVGSTAKMHSIYLKTHIDLENSWHYTVDDTEIYHHLPDNEVGWHASDGLNNSGGNLNGVGIEICVNEDGDFDQAIENAAKLTAYLLKAYRLDIDDIKQHGDFTFKNCPATLRDTGRWGEFIEKVKYYYRRT
ncbi:MAG: N-acetylmuramoyl-L-alanine amidase [Erysipelotrichaceae bacterium]|nr:N-acetylmuramoyl-L-alanine amidase [Erysipelotrichaceae bacterium]